MFKEMMMKIFMGMVIGVIKSEDIVKFINKLKADLEKKVAETPGIMDDMAVSTLLSSQENLLEMLSMCLELADLRVKESVNKDDDILWLPISIKIKEVINIMKAKTIIV